MRGDPQSPTGETTQTSDSAGDDGTQFTELPAVEKRRVKKRSREERLEKTMIQVVDHVMKAQENMTASLQDWRRRG